MKVINYFKKNPTNKIRTIHLLFIWIILFYGNTYSLEYPKEVETVLNQAGKNRNELEKAISYFQSTGDSLKLKAIYFLIANMDVHYSANYYLADNLNKNVPFNELSYPSFEVAIRAFEKLKDSLKLHPVQIQYRDIDSIKASFLIKNVELAFKVWKRPWAKNLTFSQFCEYLLPYRASIEPIEPWHDLYFWKFKKISDSLAYQNNLAACFAIKKDIQSFFINTFKIETRDEPLPRLGPLQLLFRKQGACEDIVDLNIYAMRSQGIPCCMDMVPWWATSSGRHFWNVTIDDSLEIVPFDGGSQGTENFEMPREPGKVIRFTYAKQPNVLAFKVPEQEIPVSFMRSKNYIDVTNQYWKVKDIECSLFPYVPSEKIIYASVLNFGNWKPIWWGNIRDEKTIFTNMSCGAIYLPMYYLKGKLKPAGYPVALWQDTATAIIPDTIHCHTIKILQQRNYLNFQSGKKYKLFYWNNRWILLGEKTASFGTQELIFDMVPRGALLRLIPEYSERKERPFMMTADGKRIWW